MVPHDEGGAAGDEPLRGRALGGGGPLEKLLAPVDGDDDEVREPSGEAELARDLDGGDLVHGSVPPLHEGERHEGDGRRILRPGLSEPHEARRMLEVEGEEPFGGEALPRRLEALFAEVAGVVVGEAEGREAGAGEEGELLSRDREAGALSRQAGLFGPHRPLEVGEDEVALAEELGDPLEGGSPRARDLQRDLSREEDVAGEEEARPGLRRGSGVRGSAGGRREARTSPPRSPSPDARAPARGPSRSPLPALPAPSSRRRRGTAPPRRGASAGRGPGATRRRPGARERRPRRRRRRGLSRPRAFRSTGRGGPRRAACRRPSGGSRSRLPRPRRRRPWAAGRGWRSRASRSRGS